MSGGHFDYKQHNFEDIAQEIEDIIKNNKNENLDRWGYKMGHGFPEEIIEKFRETLHWVRRSQEMVQRVDWLLSGDDGEESFLERWEEEVRKPVQKD